MKTPYSPPPPSIIEELIRSSLANASALIAEADCLSERGFWPRTHFLAATALEEMAKAQLAADVLAGDVPAALLKVALSSHFKKYAYLKRSSVADAVGHSSVGAQRFAQAAKALRENSLYVGISSTGQVVTPDNAVSEEQARHTLITAHRERSNAALLSLVPGGLSTKGAQAFAARLSKGGA